MGDKTTGAEITRDFYAERGVSHIVEKMRKESELQDKLYALDFQYLGLCLVSIIIGYCYLSWLKDQEIWWYNSYVTSRVAHSLWFHHDAFCNVCVQWVMFYAYYGTKKMIFTQPAFVRYSLWIFLQIIALAALPLVPFFVFWGLVMMGMIGLVGGLFAGY